MSAPSLAQSSTLVGPPQMTRTDTSVSAFPISLLRTPSNASGRPEPTRAPEKELGPHAFNRDDHDASKLQDQFASDLEAAAHNETARWEKVLKHDPHSAIHQAKLTAAIRICSDLFEGIEADEKAALATPRG